MHVYAYVYVCVCVRTCVRVCACVFCAPTRNKLFCGDLSVHSLYPVVDVIHSILPTGEQCSSRARYWWCYYDGTITHPYIQTKLPYSITCIFVKCTLLKVTTIYVPSADIDECGENTDDCDHVNGNCEDTVGSFRCTCNEGFEGDGRTCDGMR